jgi:uncharacterized RDD family membrane protein YckC
MNKAPGLARRMAAFIYEGVLLFGVVMISGFLYSVITQHRHALEGRVGMMVFLFIVLGVYFSWFWSRGGQTVAMKAWHIRLVAADGTPVSRARAVARYLLSWLWFLPATAAVYVAGLHGKGEVTVAVIAGVLAYAALVWLRADRQFWHDVACGTQVIDCKPALPTKAKSGP